MPFSAFAPLAPIVLLAVAHGQAVSPIPPPVAQRTAACNAIVYASDALVCGDSELREIDRTLAGLYAAADRAGVADGAAHLETANAWFSRRSLCAFSPAHRECVMAAYRERLAVMRALLAATERPQPVEVSCPDARWRGAWIRTNDGVEALVITDRGGAPVGVAFESEETRDWSVFLRAQSAGLRLTLSQGTARIECALSTALRDVADSGLRDRVEEVDALLGRSHARHDHPSIADIIDLHPR